MAGNFLPSCLYFVNATVATVSMKAHIACSVISASILPLLHYLYAHITEVRQLFCLELGILVEIDNTECK